MHIHLCLINLILQTVDRLHYAKRLILKLRQESYVLYVIVVHIVDHLRLDHFSGDRVRVLNPPFKFDLQLLILVKLFLLDRILPLESR